MKSPQNSTLPVRDRILLQAEVEAKVGFKETKLFEKVAEGTFPALDRSWPALRRLARKRSRHGDCRSRARIP